MCNVPAGTYSNYPAFRHTGSSANSILVDDVIWEALPSCPDDRVSCKWSNSFWS